MAYPSPLKKNGHPDTKLATGTAFNQPAANVGFLPPCLSPSKRAEHRDKGTIIASVPTSAPSFTHKQLTDHR